MAFDNVTFFEVHLDGANIGPSFGEEEAMDEARVDAEMDAEMEMEMETEAGAERRGRGRVVAVVALVAAVGIAAVLRRRRGGAVETDEGIEIESVDATESVAAVER